MNPRGLHAALLLCCGLGFGCDPARPDEDEIGALEEQACEPNRSCQLENPCALGVTSCTAGSPRPICVLDGSEPDGAPCGDDHACNGGACVALACVADSPCQPLNPCSEGAVTCASASEPGTCQATASKADGTPCGESQVCSEGVCAVTSVAGQPFQPSDMEATSLPAPSVSVTSLGAVCDGSRDDTSALQAAFRRVTTGGGTVVFPAGRTCVTSRTLEIRDRSGFAIKGNGATVRMKAGAPVAQNPVLRIRNAASFTVTDLTINGNRQNRSAQEAGGHNVQLTGVHGFRLERVVSRNSTTDGFYLAALNTADARTFPSDGLFLDCQADNSFRQGMSIINGYRLRLIDSSFTNTHGTAPQAGIDIEPQSAVVSPGVAHVLIRNCLVAGNAGYGITMSAATKMQRLTVEGSTFIDNYFGAINLDAAYSLVRGNLFTDHGSWAVLQIRGGTAAHDLVVRDNTFRGNPGYPGGGTLIFISGKTGARLFILNNVFRDNDNANTSIQNWNHTGAVCISGNVTEGQRGTTSGNCPSLPAVGYGT